MKKSIKQEEVKMEPVVESTERPDELERKRVREEKALADQMAYLANPGNRM